MEGTCDKNCPLWKKYKEKCPNYIESWWKPENKKEPILIKDCAPKRTFIMIQELHNRFIGVEKSQEEQRNRMDVVNKTFSRLMIAMGKDYLKHKQLTNKSKKLEK